MTILRYTRCDMDFIRNMPPKILAELALLEDVIPDDIACDLQENKVFHQQRRNFVGRRDDLISKIHEVRAYKEQLPIDDYLNFETDENVEFIKKYPQFKPLIDHIEFCDGDDPELSTIKVVPIDQYLAEN